MFHFKRLTVFCFRQFVRKIVFEVKVHLVMEAAIFSSALFFLVGQTLYIKLRIRIFIDRSLRSRS